MRIPIALDGSCSGIQNLSLAFRDEIGGAAVNIVPSDFPSDIYGLVADSTVSSLTSLSGVQLDDEENEMDRIADRIATSVESRLESMAVQKSHDAKNGQDADEVSDAELAKWWLKFGITRKVTKRNCMTFPSGAALAQ
ncbi:DNA-directed RNA polymerase [Marinobacterium rhizophilum]|uniref:DNA-directed RNA polymerase n=1 Tax=Marinobacterium rhizophilum TaxID=420402 RepID=A0ABY5HQ87_9GAMM|nr:DNA-directed RNA polymerase [Marinobacterium rhizophilum]UTW13369.1 hypothetical protein KDW95_06875 [Marinobacterium rhizophilum]